MNKEVMMKLKTCRAVACAAVVVAFSAFAEDAYIQSDADGTQSINTGYFVNPKTKIEIDYQLTSTPANARLFGEDYNTDEFIALYISGTKLAYAFGDKFSGMDIGDADTARHTVVFDSPRGTVTYVTAGVTNVFDFPATVPRTKTATRPLGLFADCFNAAGNDMGRFTPMKLYSFRIYEDDVLVHDYEPVLQRGAAGLYDRVTGEFLQDDQRVSTGKDVTGRGNYQQATTRKFGSGGDIRTLTDAEDDGFVILDGKTYSNKQFFNTQVYVTDKTAMEIDYAYADGVTANTRAFGICPQGSIGGMAEMRADGDGDLTFEVGDNTGTAVYPFFYPGSRRYRCKLDILNGKASIWSGHTTTWEGGFSARPTQPATRAIAIGGGMWNTLGNDTAHGSAKLRIYGFKIWENGTLVRDYVPCVSGTHVGLKDRVGGTFIMPVKQPMTTYGGRILREAGAAYLQSDGVKQFIDTGVTLDATSRVEFDFEAMSTGKAYLFGSTGTFSGYLSMAGLAGGGVEYICKDDAPSRHDMGSTVNMDLGARRTMILDSRNSMFVITTCGTTNLTSSITDAHTKTMKSTFTLMAARNTNQGSDAVTLFKPIRLYGCRLYKNGAKIRDYVPCLKDNIPGLRDTMTDTFVTYSDLSQPLAYGGDIELDTPAYLEADGTQILDTGYLPNRNTKIVCDYQMLAGADAQSRIFGALSDKMCAELYVQGSVTTLGLTYNSYSEIKSINGVVANDLKRHTFTLDLFGGTWSVDGGAPAALDPLSEGTDASKFATLALFGRKVWGNSFGCPAKVRIYSLEVYESGKLKHRYLPSQENGKVGMRDVVADNLLVDVKGSATPFKVGGCGVDGEAFVETPADVKLRAYGDCVLSAFAPAATAYQWYRDGKAIDGATNRTYTVSWKRKGAPETYCVKAEFNVGGIAVEQTTAPATVTHMSPGLILLVR